MNIGDMLSETMASSCGLSETVASALDGMAAAAQRIPACDLLSESISAVNYRNEVNHRPAVEQSTVCTP